MSGGLLLVGAHVGDMEFTAGHVAHQYASRGEDVTVLHLTAGEGGNPRKDRAAYRVQKLAEAEASARRLGATCLVLDNADGELCASETVADQIVQIIRRQRPDAIITHWRGTFHSDHANCHFAVQRALDLLSSAESDLPAVWYADNWEDSDGYRPDIVLDITSSFSSWREAAREHELFRGGVVAFDYQGYYEALSKLRGRMAGTDRGAAFMAQRPLPLSRSVLSLQ